MSRRRVISCVVGRECLLWPVRSLGKPLLAFFLLHFVLQGQICQFLHVSPDFWLLLSSPLCWQGHLFWVLIVEGLVDLHRTIQLQLLQLNWLGHRLGLLWYWMVCLGNEQHSVAFDIVPKYCILDSSVYYEGYSISSKGFLPTVIDIKWSEVKWSCSVVSDSSRPHEL